MSAAPRFEVATLRVMTVSPCTAAVAAIRASPSDIYQHVQLTSWKKCRSLTSGFAGHMSYDSSPSERTILAVMPALLHLAYDGILRCDSPSAIDTAGTCTPVIPIGNRHARR